MDGFDDENPFESEASFTHQPQPTLVSAPSFDDGPVPESLETARPVARAPQQANTKADFCCARDRWLHSGEDAEILVGVVLLGSMARGC
jgi:hypothetical protein